MKSRILLFFTATVLAFSLFSFVSNAESQDIESLRSKLVVISAKLSDAKIKKMPQEGLYQVFFDNTYAHVYYKDNHLLIGDLFDTKEKVNLTEQIASQRIINNIGNVSEDKMIVFPAKDKVKGTITVFTDLDCGYCRLLHSHIAQLNELGVSVRYIPFPRAGLKGKSFEKFVSVWCANNQQLALTKAKLGEEIESQKCQNPIAETYNLGVEMGITGTPTMVTDKGKLIPGYLPVESLMASLGIDYEPKGKSSEKE